MLLGFSSVSLKLNQPPNTCMPSSAKMTMKRKSSSSRLAIERIEFSSDATRFRSADQYLQAHVASTHVADQYLQAHVASVHVADQYLRVHVYDTKLGILSTENTI